MEVRLLREGEEDQMIRLLEKSFGSWHDRQYWNWLYKTNPAGKAAVGVAVEHGQILATYSICPVSLRIGSERVLAGLAVDAATDPDYRRKGLFTIVAGAAFLEADRRGFRFILGYTEWGHPAALGQLTKLGFQRAYSIRRLVKVLSWPKLLSSKLRLPFLRRTLLRNALTCLELYMEGKNTFGLRLVKDFPAAYQDYNSDLANGSVAFDKTPVQLNWRYTNHPEKRYLVVTLSPDESAIGPFLVVCLRRDEGMNVAEVVDIVGNNNRLPSLMAGLETLLRSCGFALFEVYISQGHSAVTLMKSRGFVERSHSLTVIFRPTNTTQDSDRELSRNPDRWHTSVADDLTFTG